MNRCASQSPISASDELKKSPESRAVIRHASGPVPAAAFICMVLVLGLFLSPNAMGSAAAANPSPAPTPASASRPVKATPQEAGGAAGNSAGSASSWVMSPAQTGVTQMNRLNSAVPAANAPLSFPAVLPAYQGPASTAATPQAGNASATVQVGAGIPFAPTAGLSFDGIGNGVDGVTVNSITASGAAAVGTTQIVETANQYFAAYDKTSGALVAGFPKTLGSLFSSIHSCNTSALWNPVVLYDQLAQRWLVTAVSTQQSAVSKLSASSLCIAISQNDDATGRWSVMSYSPSGAQGGDFFYDSVRAALWPDAYTFTYNLWDPSGSTFKGVAVCGLDRNGLLALGSRPSAAGQESSALSAPLQVCTVLNNSYDADLAPVTLDGANYPPPGAKALFVETAKGMGAASTYSNLFMYRAAFDFEARTVTVDPVVSIPVKPYDARVCDTGNAGTGWPNCAPQRPHTGGCYLQDKPVACGTQDNLDVFPGSIGYRAAYRNFGAYESMVLTATVKDGSEPSAANRWWEIRRQSSVASRQSTGDWVMYQDSTYSPDSSLQRFLGSIAQDHVGNMLLGYTGSGSSEFPSIYVTGREPSDPVNAMEREQRVVAGLNAQVNVGEGEYPHSWGAMSSMAMDPDDCTFWYTNEYLPTAGMFNWRSRVASFNFGARCSDAASITLPVPASAGGAPLTSSTSTFYWTPGSGKPTGYTLSVGSARGEADLCAPVTYPAGTYRATLSCLPSSAGTMWVRLTTIGGAPSGTLPSSGQAGATSAAAARFQDYEFTTAGGVGAEEASPDAHPLVTSTTTTLALTTGMSTAQIGASLTFTATVTVNGAPTPTGTVTFKSGSTAITSCSALALTGTAPYQAACATSVLAKGTDSITAAYSGDANTSASTSSALSESIVTQETTASVSSTGPLYSGLAANLNAIVSVAGTSCCEEDQYSIPGSSPVAVLYDGASFWTANNGSNSVTKVVGSGEVLGTFPAGTAPVGLAFDGANIWVANSGGLTKLRQDNGALVASYTVGGTAVLFDGANIWTTSKSAGTLIKVNPSNGSVLATYTLGNSPGAMAFDGTNLWVANVIGTVSKVVASSGSVAGTFTVGTNPGAVLYDGTNIWVGNGNGTVSKLLATTGALQATYTVGGAVTGLQFDGASIAAANGSAFVVFNPANGAFIYSLAAPGASGMSYSPNALEFVGTSTGTYGLISFAAAPGAAATPTGTVKFTSNGTTISGCSAQVLSSNSGRYVASCGTPAFTTGNYNIVATYAGDANTAASTSPTYVQVVYAVGTTITTLTNQYSTNSSTLGSPVTFLAEVVVEGVSNPTGTVAFKNNGAAISGCAAVPLNGSSGTYLETCTANSLPLGANSIVATYSGDSHTTASSSSALIQTVVGSETITAVSSSANPSVYGQPVTFTATLTPPPVYSSQNFAIGGTTPYALAFDGASIWTANPTSNNVTKLLAATGAVVGTYPVGTNPHALAFDGANIWVINENSATMTKIRASDGTVLGTFSTEQDPVAVLYDGSYIWTANLTGSDVTQWQQSSGQALTDYCCFDFPEALAYDGANLWVSDVASVVQKLQVSTGKLIGGYLVGNTPLALLFDGANMWAANSGSGSVSKIQVSTGQTLGTFAIGTSAPSGLAFDGSNLWVAGGAAITELQASNGAYVASYPLQYAYAVLYDGASIWVGYNSTLANYVTRFSPSAGSFVVAPTGSVSFSANGVPVSGCTVQSLTGSAPYKASCTTSALAGGTDTIVATYTGDSNNQGSTSSNFTQTVNGTTTTTLALTNGSNPSNFGSAVTFTATITVAGPATPAGTVEFNVFSVAISGCGAAPLTGTGPYFATCTTSGLPLGIDSIVAYYSGDANTAASNSSALTQNVVQLTGTTTSISSSPNPSNLSQSVTYTASVTPGLSEQTYAVGSQPQWLAYDGTNVWVSNYGSNTITRFNSSTGALVGTISTASGPEGMAFDGTNIWLANNGANTVTKYLASTGALVASYSVGTGPQGVLFDGTNIWVANFTAKTISKLSASGTILGTFTVSNAPFAMAFDGANIWAVNPLVNTVTKLSSAGATLGTFNTGSSPQGIAFDGTNIWIGNAAALGSAPGVQKLALSGTVVGSFLTGEPCDGIAFDGTSIWALNSNSVNDSVTKLQPGTGAVLATYPTGYLPIALVNAGSSIWVANYGASSATRIGPASSSATGTVPIVDTSNGNAAVCTVTLSGGTGTCSNSGLAAGSHNLSGTYSGDSNFSGSTGTTTQVVNSLTPTVTITNISAGYGSTAPVQVSATISWTGSATPTGAVIIGFAGSGSPIGGAVGATSCGSPSGNSFTCTANYTPSGTLAVGTYAPPTFNTLKATIAADANYSQGSSGGDTVTIGAVAPTVAIAPNPASVAYGSTAGIGLTVTATGAGSADAAPTGTVSLSAATGSFSTPSCSSSGDVLTCTSAYTPSGGLAVGSYAAYITASITAAGNYLAASGTDSLSVAQGNTTTSITPSVNPSMFGQSVTFTVVVAPVAPGAGTPTGSVPIIDTSNGNAAVCTVTLSGGTGSCSSSALAVGAHNLSGSYGGDANFTTSTGTLAQTVNGANTTTSVSSSANPSVFGQSVTFTATITSASGMIRRETTRRTGAVHTLDVTGTVTWGANTGCGTTPVSGTGGTSTATCTTSSLPVGTDAIAANYSGDSNHSAGSGSLNGGQVVNLASTSSAVTSSLNPSSYGQSVSFTATVAAVGPGAGMPTGTVQFVVDGGNFGSPVTLSSGSATSGSTTTLMAGTHTVSAVYSGDTNFTASTGSLNGGQVVNSAGAATTVASSVNPSVFGQSVTFTATINGANGLIRRAGAVHTLDVTGTVTWSANTGCGTTPVSGTGSAGTASCTTSSLPVGTDAITANYSGDSNHSGGSGSLNGGQVVNQASTSSTVSSSLNPSGYGQSVSFTASVVAIAPGVGTPTGTVQFVVDGSNFGSPATLSSGSVTSGSTATLAAGTHTVSAVYSSDTNFTTSTGLLNGGQIVNSAGAATAVGSSVNPSVSGQSVTFTATINGQYGLIRRAGVHSLDVTGTVAWSANTGCGTTPVSGTGGTGTATCTTSTLPVGTDAITANYSGDSNHSGSSGSLNGGQVVNQASTSSAVTSSLNPSSYGQAVSFTATVVAVSPGAGMPTGTVQFVVDGGNFGAPVMLASGMATSGSTTTLAAGTHTVNALYSGNTNFTTSTGSLNGGQVVNSAGAATAVAASVNPSVFGQSVTFTATINGQYGLLKRLTGGIHAEDVSGTVTWSANTGCGTTAVTAGNPGVATCTTSALPVGTDMITANYSGDSNHSASSGSLNGGQVVNQASTSGAVSSSLNPSSYGQSVSFTATVAAVAPGAGSPTGTVQFVVDGSTFGSPVTVLSGSASSGSATTLAAGTHTVSAVYSGDTSFTASTGTLNGGQIVNSAGAATAVTSSVNPSAYGQSVTFTATISGQYGLLKKLARGFQSEDVSGTVVWSANTGCGSTPVSGTGGTGIATCTTSTLPVGTDTITANYSGDSNHSGSSGSLNGGQVVNQASTSGTVSSSLNPSTYGQSVSFTATVAAVAPGAGSPSGTVQFVVDGSNFGSPVTLSSGMASSGSTTTLAAGTHTVSAVYSGDTNFTASTGSLSGGQVVNSAGAATTVAASVNPSAYGQSVTFTATINGQYGLIKRAGVHSLDVTGTVTWSANTGCGTTPVSGTGGIGTATCTTSTLPVGTDAITANYSGDSNHSGSTGSLNGGQVVNQASTSSAISSNVNPSAFGQTVMFTVTVSPVGPGSGTPTGAVPIIDISNGNAAVCTVTLAGGTGTCSSATLAEGAHNLSGGYPGDANFTGSTGSLTQTVNGAGTSTAVSSSVNPSVFGQSVTFTATISSASGMIRREMNRRADAVHSLDVAGTVTWSANTGCGTTPVSGTGGTGTATCTTSTLPVGTDAITANYSGDSNHSGSTGSLNGGQVVNQASTSGAVSSSLNPSSYGQSVSFTAMVAAVLPGAGSPTGTMQFKVDGGNFGAAVTLASGAATSGNTTTLAAGTHTVSAVYSGDSNFTASTGTLNGGQVVNNAGAATTVTSGMNPSVFGQAVTITATINGQYGLIKKAGVHTLAATGTVTWSANTGCGTTPVSGTGGAATATCTTSALPVGTDAITANYSGDSNHSGSSGSLNGGQVVGQASSSSAVISSLNPSNVGQSVSFTATVAAVAPGAGAPTGTVQFVIDTASFGTPVTLSGGSATSASTTTLSGGTHTVSAIYSGDSNFKTSTGTLSGGQVVNQSTPSTTTTVASSKNPLTYGQTVIFTASVASSAGNMTGTVAWSANTGCGSTPLSGTGTTATATCATSSLTVGTDVITATYSGDSAHSGSSGTLSGGELVSPYTPTISVGNMTTTYGSTTGVTAAITVAGLSGGSNLTGAVSCASGAATGGSCAVSSCSSGTSVTCTATWTSTGTLAAGTYAANTITATIAAGGNYAANTSAANSVTVSKASSTTSITSNAPNPSAPSQAVTIAFKVSGIHTPTGSVKVTASTGENCTGSLVSGSGSCMITFTTADSRTLTAAYSGDGNFNTSNSAPVTQNVNASGPTVTLTPSNYNFGNIYLAKSASTQFTLSNTGSVTLTISQIAIGTTGTDPDDFTESNNCHSTLAAGKSCTITVTFASDSDVLGLNTGALTVSDNATGSPQTATLSATVINPQVKLSPASLNFGNQKVNTTSVAKTITLTNSGTTTLTLGAVSISGDFAIASGTTCTNGGSVTAGASCKINVTFTPKAKGTRTGTLTITDNALNSPQTAALSGTGD